MIIEVLTSRESLLVRLSEIETVPCKDIIDSNINDDPGKERFFLSINTKNHSHKLDYVHNRTLRNRDYYRIMERMDPNYDYTEISK